MGIALSDELKGVLDGANFAHLATVNSDGAPHVSAMWIERDSDMIHFNTAAGRRKAHNVQRDPRVSISISPGEQPYQNFTILGRVVEVTTDGADEMIDRLAGVYMGVDEYPYRQPGEVRLKLVVEPTHASSTM